MLYIHHLSTLKSDHRVLKEAKSLIDAGNDVKVLLYDDFYHETIEYRDCVIDCLGILEKDGKRIKVDRGGILLSILLYPPFNKLLKYFFNFLSTLSPLKLGKYMRNIPYLLGPALRVDADVYHVHDIQPLWVGFLCKMFKKCKYVYDSHELFLDMHDVVKLGSFRRALIKLAEGFLSRRADAVITANHSYGDILSRRHHIEPPVVLHNFVNYREIPNSDLLRDNLGIDKKKKIVLFQGYFIIGRGLFNLIETAKILDDVVFVFLGSGEMKKQLEESIEENHLENVKIMDAVPLSVLLDYTASADIGISPFQNVSPSTYYSLPNKIGEYIMAGIPFACSNFPEMRKLAVNDDLGVVFDPEDPNDIARAIRELLKLEIYARKKKNILEARRKYNWENEEKKLLAVYEKLSESI